MEPQSPNATFVSYQMIASPNQTNLFQNLTSTTQEYVYSNTSNSVNTNEQNFNNSTYCPSNLLHQTSNI